MTNPSPKLAPALQRLRTGDLIGAREAIETALSAEPHEPALLEFAGLLAVQMADPGRAVVAFRQLVEILPDNRSARVNLAAALVAAGQLAEAEEICSGSDDAKLRRLVAYVHQQQGRLAEAVAGYEGLVSDSPTDFESWNNLGNARAALGDFDGAIDAFEKAITLRPDIAPIYVNLSEVLATVERAEARQKVMRDAARVAPGDPRILIELGLAESGARDFAAAERAFREAIRLDARAIGAYLELGLVLENLNRIDELGALVDEAEARGLAGPELGFVRAWALRRQGRFEEALPLALATPPTINPVRRAQLVAEVHDRLGHTEQAFAAFEEMNAASLAARPVAPGPTYRERLGRKASWLTPERIAAWPEFTVEPMPPAPIFIVGFPRSGTTLLDTLLMNLPDLHVLEEQPVLQQVERALGDEARIAELGSAEVRALRERYFEALELIQPCPPGKQVVDKFPLHMASVPLIHRIFPDAKLILVERHPCDSVLSCFMSNFRLNPAMRSFTSLEEAARTYDAVFDIWTRSLELLPVDVHRVRYENMVEDLETEMRALLDHLGMTWDPAVLDNRSAAARREHIRTASYSQVGEAIYRRSAGRWQRYRAQLEPILPILAPWAERMGYDI